MKTLHLSIIAILLVTSIFGMQHAFAQNVTNSSNVISPIPSSILHSPVPTLPPPENQSIVSVALAIPELQNWSHDWKYIDTSFLGNNKLGIAGGFQWQYAIVTLKAPSSSAPVPCDNDWWAWIEIDMTTMKVVQATYPTMESHQCEVAMGGGSVTSHVIAPVAKSPLKQFKLGIKAEDVKCGSNLHLIIKAEDGSFACVTIKTGIKLVLREWAATFGTGISTSDYTKCDIPYHQSDAGVAVLYMPTNIIGKICVQYHNLNNAPTTIGMRIFEANDLTHNATNVTAWTYDSTLEANANKTVVYFIKTGNKTGFYGASLNCGGFPLAVGYGNNSAITANNFPWIGQVFHCGVITYDSHLEGTTGIGVKYIPYP